MDFDSIVTIKVRTGKDEEFMSGGRVYRIDSKRGLKLPRNEADLAMQQLALRWNKETGGVTESLIYIEDDFPEPPKPITQEQIKASKATSGMGSGTVMIDGKPVAFKSINLNPEG